MHDSDNSWKLGMRTLTSTRPDRSCGFGSAIENPLATRLKDIALRLPLAMLGIIVLAAVLRLHGLNRTSIWNDEASSWNMARHPFLTMLREQAGDNNPPLFDIILYVVIRVFGDSATMLRLPSAVLGIVNVYLLYRLGAVLWDRFTGGIAAALLALSGFHIWYSQEARMYALFCAMATAFALTTVLFLIAPTRTRTMLCGLTGIALFYSHTFGPLVWVAVNVVVVVALLTRARWIVANGKIWLTIQVLIVLIFLPWVEALLGSVRHVMQGFWIPFPTLSFLSWTFGAMTGGVAMAVCLGCLVLLSFVPVAEGRYATTERRIQPAVWSRLSIVLGWRNLLLLSWALLPFVVAYGVSVVGQPIITNNYLMGSLPPTLLLAARGLMVLRFSRLILISAVVIVFACTLPGIYKNLIVNQREDFRAAVAAFSVHFLGSDLVLFGSPGARNAFSYYYRSAVAHQTVMGEPETNEHDLLNANRIWVIARSGIGHRLIFANGKVDVPSLFGQIKIRYHVSEMFEFPGVTVYLFRNPALGGIVEAAD